MNDVKSQIRLVTEENREKIVAEGKGKGLAKQDDVE